MDKNDNRRYNVMERSQPYANTWLLTTITGADYLDRNNNGVADEGDWGFWVNFQYGQFEDDYVWRYPFYGTKLDGSYKTVVTGKKELYYLDQIQTRTHTAIFFKSKREDGRGATVGGELSNGLGLFTLKLDDIYLLQNNIFNELITPTGQGGKGLSKSDNVWMGASINIQQRDFLKINCLKRIGFKYDYSLSYGVPNRQTTGGKLTLTEIDIYGRNDFKVMPSYKLFYNEGSYQSNTNSWGYHPIKPDTYSLKKVITPLGSEILIEYESDDYHTISGRDIPSRNYSVSMQDEAPVGPAMHATYELVYHNKIEIPSDFYPAVNTGDQIRLNITTFKYTSTNNSNYPPTSPCVNINTSISPKEFVVVAKEQKANGTCFLWLDQAILPQPIVDQITSCLGNLSQLNYQFKINEVVRKGGDIRVKKITATDGMGNSFDTEYLYTVTGMRNDKSSGVVSLEPIGVPYRLVIEDISNSHDYPMLPVTYSKVAVLSGKVNNVDYDTKTVYNFVTPQVNMVNISRPVNTSYELVHEYDQPVQTVNNINHKFFHKKEQIAVDINTSKIGSINSVQIYDQNNQLVKEVNYQYANRATQYQGVFTQSVLSCDLFSTSRIENDLVRFRAFNENKIRTARTTKKYNPNILIAINETKYENGIPAFTSKQENLSWDFYTGQTLTKKMTNSMGLSMLTETRPAYTIYPEMGLKSHNINNKHMLTQTAGSAAYKMNADTKIGLLGASVQTWKKDWGNFRDIDTPTGEYKDSNQSNRSAWWPHQFYTWAGTTAQLVKDGTYNMSLFNPFVFNSSENPGWVKTGEVTRYSLMGAPLETSDISGIYSSMKIGNKSQIISNASNASYVEAVFSGAEDFDPATGYFGGEVRKGASANVTVNTNLTYIHTGAKSLRINNAADGFIYKVKGSEIDKTRNYRASVWIHEENKANGKLYYRFNNNVNKVTAGFDATMKAGSWYQINILIPVDTAVTSLEIGCTNISTGSVYFDDFRFQPVDASLTANVYNEFEQLTHVLDNNNLYTRFTYDDGGQVIETFVEVLNPAVTSGEKKVSERRYNYARWVE